MKKTFFVCLLSLFTLLSACSSPPHKVEISQDPTVILDEDFDVKNSTSYGVACGDSTEKVKETLGDNLDKSGSFAEGVIAHNSKNVAYVIASDKVISFTIQGDLVKNTGIDLNNTDQFFGHPDKEESHIEGIVITKEYSGRGISTIFFKDSREVFSIDLACK